MMITAALALSLIPSGIGTASEPRIIEPALVIRAGTSVAAIPDRRFVFGRSEGWVYAWHALTGNLVAQAKGEGGAIDPRTGIAILGTEVWNLNERERLIETGLKESEATAAGITRDGRFALIGGKEVQIWDLGRKKLIGRVKTKARRASFLALSDNAGYIAVGRGTQFDVFDIPGGKLVRTGALAAIWPFRTRPSKGFSEFVNDHAVDFSVIYEQGEETGDARQRPLWKIDWEADKVNVFADFLPGTGLSAQPRGKTVEVSWAVEGSSQAVLVGHEAAVRRVAFSPDRWTLATGDEAGDVRLWDTYNGAPLYQCRGGGEPIVSLSFSPDAQFLLAASRSEIRVYPVSP